MVYIFSKSCIETGGWVVIFLHYVLPTQYWQICTGINGCVKCYWPLTCVAGVLTLDLCYRGNLPSLQRRHVAIARLKHPANMGRTSKQVKLFILVLCPSKEVSTVICLARWGVSIPWSVWLGKGTIPCLRSPSGWTKMYSPFRYVVWLLVCVYIKCILALNQVQERSILADWSICLVSPRSLVRPFRDW